jgi:hypothetical protein
VSKVAAKKPAIIILPHPHKTPLHAIRRAGRFSCFPGSIKLKLKEEALELNLVVL